MSMEEAAVLTMGGGSFERMRQEIWKCLMDPRIRVFSVLGWEGVGRSMITRQVLKELTKLQEGEGKEETGAIPFDRIIWLERSVSRRAMLQRIAEAFGIQVHEGRDELLILFDIIRNSSPNVRSLIVVDGVDTDIWNVDPTGEIGKKWTQWIRQLGKLVVVTASADVCREMGSEVEIKEEWGSLSDDEAWALLCHVLADAANDSDIQVNLTNGGDTLLQWFSPLLLFSSSTPYFFTFYCKLLGFSHDSHGWVELSAVSLRLERVLHSHCLLESPDHGDPEVCRSLRSKLIRIFDPIGCSPCNYPSWHRIKWRRFPVRCGLELQEAPRLAEWEQENVEKISLESNDIKSLEDIGPPPKCPRLSTLILSRNPLSRMPEDFFQHMQGLLVLDLSRTDITSLPSSMSSLTNLRLLSLEHCPRLDTLPHPLLFALQNLEVLLLRGSVLPNVTALSLHMMQNLYFLHIDSATNLTQLSLKGCHSFKHLEPPGNLEMLDLSGTKIRDFNDFNVSKLKSLRRLDLLDMKHLTNVPWDDIDRLPQTLNWDQCGGHQYSVEEKLQTGRRYCISVCDDKIFQTLSKGSVLWTKELKKFTFSVASCNFHRQQPPEDAENRFQRTCFIYRRIYAARARHFSTESVRSYDRCLEIGSTNYVPYGIRGVLYHTEFLSLCGNNSIPRLSHLGVENMDNLIECRIEECQNMQSLLTIGSSSRNLQRLSKLENLLVFDLLNLKSLCRGTFGEGSFACLKCIHLEHCPRLRSLFSSSVRLGKLVTLEVRFCNNLERVFEEEDAMGQDVFPQLKELYLEDLRKLKSICNGHLPALEKMKIHGCRRLQNPPLLVASHRRP